MISPIDVNKILRYLSGESEPQEAEEIERWSRQNATNRAIFEALRDGAPEQAARLKIDVSQGIRALRDRIDAAERPAPAKLPGRGKSSAFWYSITGISLSAILLFAAQRSLTGEYTSEPNENTGSTYTTANGRRASVTLPDGSVVSLNVASKIEIPHDFLKGNRVVYLEGEALFTVTHSQEAPFTVIAGPSTTRVLGTRFAVRFYDTDTAAVVSVDEGRVAVQSLVMSAGQQVTVSTHGIGYPIVTNPGASSFAQGLLALEEMPLIKAIEVLNRWYDADILLGDPQLVDLRLGGQFTEGTVEDLARILEWTFGVRIVQDGRILTLYSE